MECLPSDIVLDMLSRLPVDSVLNCKLVSKWLLNLLTHQWNQFAKMHHQRQLLQLASSSTCLIFSFKKIKSGRIYYGDKYNDEMDIHENYSYKTLQKASISYPRIFRRNTIVGSCNGLICLNRYHHGIPDPIYICNPNTGEYVNLPEYILHDQEAYASAYGFGYVHSSMTNDQYKVVRIYYPRSDNYEKGEVKVYTIGGCSGWRTIGTTSYLLYNPHPLGIFVNGALHWIGVINLKIVAFNLADEEFQLIQSPICYNRLNYCFYSVQSFRGNLCFCNRRNEEHLLDIWSLKKNATTEASWSRDFSVAYCSSYGIDYAFPAIPLLITKKNEVLFVHQSSILYCYDPKTGKVMKLWDDNQKPDLIMRLTAVPHMNSFVSLV